jgi:vacuolar iron transporter family protein
MPAPLPEDDWDQEGQSRWRMVRVHLNDGVIASAGVVLGLTSAEADTSDTLIAAVATTVIGGLIILGAEYNEAAGERDSQFAIIEAERLRLAMSPDEEFEELVGIYQRKGLSPATARQVARELSDRDALGAQLDAEYGIDHLDEVVPPLRIGLISAAAFAVGALLPFLLVLLTPLAVWREVTVFVVAGLALTASAIIGARSDHTNPVAAVARTLAIGLGTMGISIAAGELAH